MKHEVVTTDVLHPSPEFLALSPMGQIPLVVDGEDVTFDSQLILEKYLPERLGPVEPDRAISQHALGIMSFCVNSVLEKMRPQPSLEWLEEWQDGIGRLLHSLEKKLQTSKPQDFHQASDDVVIALQYLGFRLGDWAEAHGHLSPAFRHSRLHDWLRWADHEEPLLATRPPTPGP
jgi:hypothetical protein